jgi:hypothetical protein
MVEKSVCVLLVCDWCVIFFDDIFRAQRQLQQLTSQSGQVHPHLVSWIKIQSLLKVDFDI